MIINSEKYCSKYVKNGVGDFVPKDSDEEKFVIQYFFLRESITFNLAFKI